MLLCLGVCLLPILAVAKEPDVVCFATGQLKLGKGNTLILELGCVDQNDRRSGVFYKEHELQPHEQGFFVPPFYNSSIAVVRKGSKEAEVTLYYKKKGKTQEYQVPHQEGDWNYSFASLVPGEVIPKAIEE